MPHIVGLQTLRVNREWLPRLGKGHAGGDREAIARLVQEGDVLRSHRGYSLEEGSVSVNTSVYDFLETSFVPIAEESHLAYTLLGSRNRANPANACVSR